MPTLRNDLENVWVLWWQPMNDVSDGDIVRIYENKDRAFDDYALIKDDFTKNYHLSSGLLYKNTTEDNK